VIIDAPGGGGYGHPLERDPELVEQDVAEGSVTAAKARSDYGVVIDPAAMKVDEEATRALRRSMRSGPTRKKEPSR